MKLLFGNKVTTVTTVMLLGLVGFIFYCYINKKNINYWGRRTLFMAIYGLQLCCFAATRDGLDKTIQNSIDGSCMPGIFQLISIPTIVGCIGAFIIIVSGIITLFTKSQQVKEVMFFSMSGGVLLKILVVEVSRIFVYLL